MLGCVGSACTLQKVGGIASLAFNYYLCSQAFVPPTQNQPSSSYFSGSAFCHYWSPYTYGIGSPEAKPGSQAFRMSCPRVPAPQGMLKNSSPVVPAPEAHRTDICVQRRDATTSRGLLVKFFTTSCRRSGHNITDD